MSHIHASMSLSFPICEMMMVEKIFTVRAYLSALFSYVIGFLRAPGLLSHRGATPWGGSRLCPPGASSLGKPDQGA